MVVYKYGTFADMQFEDAITYLRRKIFFLLLIVDKRTRVDYPRVDVEHCFHDVFYVLNGLNEILREPKELVTCISMLCSALEEYKNPNFSFLVYRKLILDAGNELEKVKGVVSNAKP